ncbi:hypothetical protein WA026_021523 [Henosepilachna vigintioctopunctata]|uniref:Uncharacterized protein n=1 Tax=Henosepilachna vigintioctopunctata TaxID=420089 RepID=A0AAW1VJ18_9CUCU
MDSTVGNVQQHCRSATYQKYVVTEELLCLMLFDVPLNLWWKQFSESMTSVRRSLILGDLVSPELLALMKLMNVTIRCLERPDMKVEHWNRSTIIPRKVMLNAVGEAWPISAYSVYGKKFVEKFKTVLINTSVDAPIDMKFGKIGKKMIKKYNINEMSLLRDALDEIIRWTPQKRAYYFLKPEPWHKQRALYATYDEESFVSAYANAGIENQMSKHKGVFVRQTPADVIHISCGLAGAEGHDKYWVSTDYSDYNSEHSLREMSALDLCYADYYDETKIASSTQKIGCDERQIAHYWNLISIKAKAKSVIIYSDSEDNIISEGREFLPYYVDNKAAGCDHKHHCPGNIWIHAADMLIGEDTLTKIGTSGYKNINWSAVCGDDEDAAFASITSAILYTSLLAIVGHAINPMKQTAGEEFHEFLQFVISRNTRIEKSMNTLLASLVVGNWYAQKGVWLQSSISAVFSKYWALYLRGMPLQVAKRLAAITLENLMQTNDDEGNVKLLEWRKYRYAKGLPPLYAYNGDDTMRMPK